MYFPIGWPKQLNVKHNPHHLAANSDRSFIAVLSNKTLGVWFCKPDVELVRITRSEACLEQHGHNLLPLWKPNSLYIAIVTSLHSILFYRVDKNKKHSNSYQLIYPNNGAPEDSIPNLQCIPSITLTLSHHVQIPGGVTSMVSLKEDLVVATGRGLLQRVGWQDARIKTRFTIELASLPFSSDLQQFRAMPLNDSSVYAHHLDYSPQVGGFSIVLSNGKAAFLASPSFKFEPNQMVGVWAQEINEATCTSINHKFSLIAFGDKSGDATVYQMDIVTGSLVISHKLTISSKDLPDARHTCGAVESIRWSDEGAVVMVSWAQSSFALWSAFGSLLFHSLSLFNCAESSSLQNSIKVSSMEWVCGGYHLWMIKKDALETRNNDTNNDVNDIDENKNHVIDASTSSPLESSSSHTIVPSSSDDDIKTTSSQIILFNFVKSSLLNNPFLGNQVHLLLQSEDKLYLNPDDNLGNGLPTNHQSSVLSNRQWHVLTPPSSYLASNWPIKFAAMNSAGHWLAVAGRRGFIHYSLLSRRWKMFGNETQENDLMVTGGLAWWKEFICVPCFNLLQHRDEIRLYSRETKLDNMAMVQHRVHSYTNLINVYLDLLIILSNDSTISIFSLKRLQRDKDSSTAELTLLQDINIDNFIPQPFNVLNITLTSLRTDAGRENMADKQAESILINVAGRLLLFQRDRNDSSAHNDWLSFTAPVVVASSVETMWLAWKRNPSKPHLTDALWLACGASGLKVWLPVLLKEDDISSRRRGFLSKRIMVPLNADVYPLAMLFEAGIILGAVTESMPLNNNNNNNKKNKNDEEEINDEVEDDKKGDGKSFAWNPFSYLLLERTSQIYLHHILRQLLRRNLGIHALEIARSCTSLTYFPHVLELLVHEVLEEEATSKEPIPDALLPRVVAFVEEFPEYLQTIAHCARKSDAAVWEAFFAVVGCPSDLFQNCLQTKQLTTASSYLIILQNLQTPAQARQNAIALLDAALDDCMWDLARDLVRYLSAIGNDNCSTHNVRKRQNSQSKYFCTPSPTTNPDARDPFNHANTIRTRSLSKEDTFHKNVESPAIKSSRQMSGSTPSNNTPIHDKQGDKMDINNVLERHARKLMTSYRLFHLARFAANLDNYHLVAWLKKEKLHSARVDDFVAAIKAVHEDFKVAYPCIPTFQFPRINSGSVMQLTQDDDVSSSDMSSNVIKRSTSLDQSEMGSISALDSYASTPTNNNQEIPIPSDVDKLCIDLLSISESNPQANLQLRYLYQLLMEGECLEWGLVVSIVLQDVSLFSRVVTSAYSSSTSPSTINSMLRGATEFVSWSTDDCPGYSNFVGNLKEDFLLLESLEKKLLTTNKRASLNTQQHTSPPPQSPTQNNANHQSCTSQQPLYKPQQVLSDSNNDQFHHTYSNDDNTQKRDIDHDNGLEEVDVVDNQDSNNFCSLS